MRPTRTSDGLPWLAVTLVTGWAYLWLVQGAHGARVNLLLVAAFAAVTIWGWIRAR